MRFLKTLEREEKRNTASQRSTSRRLRSTSRGLRRRWTDRVEDEEEALVEKRRVEMDCTVKTLKATTKAGKEAGHHEVDRPREER